MGRVINFVVTVISGVLFTAAWWIFVDGIAFTDIQPGYGRGDFYLYVPGILTTIGFFLMSNLPTSMFEKDNSDEHTWWQKLILVISFLCYLGGIICSIWCYVEKKNDRKTNFTKWRGESSIIQSLMITLAGLIWNFLYNDDGYQNLF
ncbi:Transmembrane protein 50A [Tritrichomonas musculus]|uniref:Transmembrane protein 50A n=1 Tax=Tritrichomonas musculus TaxID=1915356 RepID=A0ABR2H3M9_9EUKA